jgi:hypothetical protein
MNKLATGQDATLGNYRALASVVFGNDSGATKFLDDKIAESPNGRDEEVIVDERQMIYLLAQMYKESAVMLHNSRTVEI